MKLLSLLAALFFAFSICADPITDIKTDDYCFKNLFDRDLYDLSKVNDYDKDPLNPNPALILGAALHEDADQKWTRLEIRKLNKLRKEKIVPALEYVAELDKSTWSKVLESVKDKVWRAGRFTLPAA